MMTVCSTTTPKHHREPTYFCDKNFATSGNPNFYPRCSPRDALHQSLLRLKRREKGQRQWKRLKRMAKAQRHSEQMPLSHPSRSPTRQHLKMISWETMSHPLHLRKLQMQTGTFVLRTPTHICAGQPIWNHGPRVFNLSRSELENTHVDVRVLAGIIGSCTALKELIYVWDDTGRNSQVDDCKDKGADLQFPGLKRALNQHSNSLECLEIRTRRSHSPPFFTRASECSFVAHNVLKNLKIRLADVTADDSNDRSWFLGPPRSLERLTLELPDVPLSFDIPEALREFARRVPGRFSMLRKIELKAMNLPRHFADFDEFDGMVEWFSPVEVDGGEQARNWMNDEDWMADENGINDENDMALERAYEDGDYDKI
jgi:hypothetical protein